VSLYILSRSIAGVFRIEELSKALKVISLIFPFATVGATLLGTLNGLRRMREYAAAVVLQSMTILAFSILAITLGYGVTGVMASYVLASIAYCAVLIYTCRNDFGLRLRRFKVTASKILAFGWKNAAANGVNLVNLSADTLLVAYFLTTRDVGYYGVAIILSRIFLAIPGAIQIITFPASSEYLARKDLKTLQTMIEKSMKYTSCILFPIAVALGLFAGGVVGLLYGTEYTQSVGPLVILVVGSATLGILGSVGGTLYGLGRPELALMGGIATASTNVTLNLLLIPLFGIIGAAFATATSFIFGTVLVSYLIQKAGHIRIDFIWHTKNGVLFVTVLALGQFLKTDKPFGAAVALVAWATYVLIMLRFLLGPEDLGLIRTSLRDLFQRE
jgi:O-antigen/teichoic acid export membrane protein